jgi:WD40 repeat protein
LKLWDVEGKRTIYTSSENADAVGSVAWSPDGARLATGAWNGAGLKIFDAKSQQMVLDLTGGRRFGSPGQYTISWNPAGDRLAACYQNGEIVIWDAATGQQVTVMHGHTSALRAVAWSPDGNRLASGGYERYVKIWDARSGRELLSLAGHAVGIYSVNWSPDGQKLATAASKEVKIWDASTGYRLRTVSEPLPEQASGPMDGQAPATAPSTPW